MNKIFIFYLINFILIVNRYDQKIILDYIINSYKYINIYNKNNKCLFIKSLLFRILFLILFMIYPAIALFNSIKKRSFKLFILYLKHPITIFDPTLKSYNLYLQKNELKEGQNEKYWKILFNYYNFKTTQEINPNSNILKILVFNNKIKSIRLNDFDVSKTYVENIKTGTKFENKLPSNIINSIKRDSIKIYKKVSDKFKVIELSVMVYNDDYSFISGTSSPDLIDINDINYIPKVYNIINFLHNPIQ